jgi:hypothetical protein
MEKSCREDLAHVAQHPQPVAAPGIAHRDANAQAALGQRPHDLAADKAGAPENRHQSLHGRVTKALGDS